MIRSTNTPKLKIFIKEKYSTTSVMEKVFTLGFQLNQLIKEIGKMMFEQEEGLSNKAEMNSFTKVTGSIIIEKAKER